MRIFHRNDAPSGAVVDERQLAEMVADAEHAEDDLASVSPPRTTLTRPCRTTNSESPGSFSNRMTLPRG